MYKYKVEVEILSHEILTKWELPIIKSNYFILNEKVLGHEKVQLSKIR